MISLIYFFSLNIQAFSLLKLNFVFHSSISSINLSLKDKEKHHVRCMLKKVLLNVATTKLNKKAHLICFISTYLI